MWTTVIVLALALNLEPNRLGIIGLLLMRPDPIRQLLVFLCTSFLVNSAAGLIVLFVVNRGALLQGASSSAIMQIAVGALALTVAAVLFTNISMPGSKARAVSPAGRSGEPAAVPSSGLVLVDNFTKRFGNLVQGRSLWFAAALGVGIALPSVDFVALLLLIAASGEPPKIQVSALFTFLTVANTILLIPMFGYVFAKERTVRILENLRSWVLARSRRDYAVLLAIAGALMLTVGVRRL
ncbi:GAP family protein [Mycolicibacterium sp.]|uniref:GAP family protein n=1 Tax=Mycolicibacterium sp. TaxID=2320850 RepID=UPI001A24CE4B|nr:GAP family protein [Mycolicibacterium sp.]MBJ7399428.1 GAP family protein [Mycolicibacterium sp.]